MPRSKPKPKPCPWCRAPADRECDGPVVRPDGDTSPHGNTCSVPVCSRCSTHQPAEKPITGFVCFRGRGGRGCEPIDNRGDLCPFCAGRRGQPALDRETHDDLLATTLLGGPKPGERIYLIDADGWIHRLYHAIPLEHAPSGQPVNALVGFLRTLRKLRSRIEPKPRWILPVFDGAPDGGWRAQLHSGYKAERPPKEPELEQQFPLILDMLDALGIAYARTKGVEADDLIASYTEAAVQLGLEVVVVSNDKDLLQLLRGAGGPGSVLGLSAFGDLELRGPEYVREKFGVGPERLADLLALAGDKVDGIPGAPGIGPKTAAKMLTEPEPRDLAAVLDNWSIGIPRKIGDWLRDNADQVRMSRELVGLRSEPLPVQLHELRPWGPKRSALDRFFGSLGYPRFEAALDRYDGQ